MVEEQPYQKREIDIFMQGMVQKFEDVNKKLDRNNDYQNKELAEIKGMVSVTNGKVADIQKWREQTIGAIKATAVLGVMIIVPLLTWAFITVSKIDDKIKEGIESALLDYEKVEIK